MEANVSRVRKMQQRDSEKMPTASCISSEMRDAVIFAAGTRTWNDNRPSWLARAARVLGITPGRASSLFYMKVRNVPAWEADSIRIQLRRLKDQQRALGERHAALETALGTSGVGRCETTAPLFRDDDGMGGKTG